MPKESPVKKTQKTKLLNINELFAESWNRLKTHWLNALLLSIAMYSVYFLFAIVAIVVLGLVGLGVVVSSGDDLANGLTAVTALGVGGLLLIVVAIAIGVTFQGALISLFSSKKRSQFGLALSHGWQHALGLFVVGFVITLVSLGSVVFLIIPALIVCMFLSMTMFEVVLNNKPVLTALARSNALVTRNFWPYFGRLLLFVGLYILVIIIGGGISSFSDGLGFVFNLVTSTLLGWFGLSYFLVMWENFSAITDLKKVGQPWWIYILSGLGWALLVVFAGAIITALSTFVQSEEFSSILETFSDPEFQSLLMEATDDEELAEQELLQLIEQFSNDEFDAVTQ